jgi:hypothetical protein
MAQGNTNLKLNIPESVLQPLQPHERPHLPTYEETLKVLAGYSTPLSPSALVNAGIPPVPAKISLPPLVIPPGNLHYQRMAEKDITQMIVNDDADLKKKVMDDTNNTTKWIN